MSGFGRNKVGINGGGNDVIVSPDGQLHVVMEGKVDSNNCTDTPLLAGAVFTGTATDILPYGAITLSIHADQASAAKGMVVQFSDDGSDWHLGEEYDIVANTQKFFTPPVQSAFYRIVYTNGAVNQTVFHIHAVLKKQPVKWSSHNIDDPIKDQDDAVLTKTVITGKRVDGTYDNANLTNGNNLKVSLEEIEPETIANLDTDLAIARGLVPGIVQVNKFGAAIDSVDMVKTDIWDGAALISNIWAAPTQARLHDISSTSTDDDGAPLGLGARTIRIWGLQTWHLKETFEDIIMNGTTNVPTVNSYVIIHRMKMLTHGASGPNVGYISATAQVDGTVTAQISPTEGQSLMAIYGMPSTQKIYLEGIKASMHDNGIGGQEAEVDWDMVINESPDVDPSSAGFVTKYTGGLITTATSADAHPYKGYLECMGPCILKINATGSKDALHMSAQFGGKLIDN